MVIYLDNLNLFPTLREVPIPLDLMYQSFEVSLGNIYNRAINMSLVFPKITNNPRREFWNSLER